MSVPNNRELPKCVFTFKNRLLDVSIRSKHDKYMIKISIFKFLHKSAERKRLLNQLLGDIGKTQMHTSIDD